MMLLSAERKVCLFILSLFFIMLMNICDAVSVEILPDLVVLLRHLDQSVGQ